MPEQRDAIARYGARMNLTISEWFEEIQTAAKKGRPVWSQMLKGLRKGRAQGVVIHKIDRSARNLKDWADLGDLIDQGIEVHFANETLDLHSRGGRLSADIQAVIAADYIRNLREETKKGLYGRLKQGIYPLGAPIGYLDQGGGKLKTIDPVRGPLVRKAFELYASQKFTLHPLRDELYQLGLRNKRDGRVTLTGLSTILNNPFYTGVIRIKKTGETFQGNHEPLISPKLFKTVQDTLSGRFHTKAKHHDFLFRRLIRCAECGYKLIGETSKGFLYYRCHTRTCPTNTIREDAAHAVITDKLKQLELTQDEKQCLADELRELKSSWLAEREQVITNLSVLQEKLTERLKRATDAYLDGVLEHHFFEERKTELLFERQSLQAKLTDIRENRVSVPELLEKFLERAGAAYSLYEMADVEQKRQIVKTLTSNLALRAKSLEFAYAIPFNVIAERDKSALSAPRWVIARTWDPLLRTLLKLVEDGCDVSFGLPRNEEEKPA